MEIRVPRRSSKPATARPHSSALEVEGVLKPQTLMGGQVMRGSALEFSLDNLKIGVGVMWSARVSRVVTRSISR